MLAPATTSPSQEEEEISNWIYACAGGLFGLGHFFVADRGSVGFLGIVGGLIGIIGCQCA